MSGIGFHRILYVLLLFDQCELDELFPFFFFLFSGFKIYNTFYDYLTEYEIYIYFVIIKEKNLRQKIIKKNKISYKYKKAIKVYI